MKIDLHCHSYYSKDGVSSPEKLVKSAKKIGLDGIALTDHETTKGWDEAKGAAKDCGIFLILGQEQKTEKGDVLGLFLEKEVKSKKFIEAVKEIKSQGGIVILPHPFHPIEGFKDDIKKYLDLIDGIEVLNGRLPFSFFDKKAKIFAKKYNLAEIGGSDAHFHKAIGSVFTVAETKNLEEFKEAILDRKTKAFGKKSPFFYLIFPTLGKLGLKIK